MGSMHVCVSPFLNVLIFLSISISLSFKICMFSMQLQRNSMPSCEEDVGVQCVCVALSLLQFRSPSFSKFVYVFFVFLQEFNAIA